MASLNALKKRFDANHSIITTLEEEELVSLLEYASSVYYNSDTVFMTDEEFDEGIERLRTINSLHPLLEKVGSSPASSTEAIKLPYWLGSLSKVKDEKNVEKWLSSHEGSIILMPKLDGASVLLEFKNGKYSLYSRGRDGVGQNLNSIVPYLNLPQLDSDIALRVEIIIAKENYDLFNVGDKDPRPISTGLINAKTPDIKLLKKLSFVVYEQIFPNVIMSKGLLRLKKLGFNVVKYEKYSSGISFKSLQEKLALWREESSFRMDGLVLFHNIPYERVWGQKYPSYAIAFKDPDSMAQKVVRVIEVKWRCSKDGYFKPTVYYQPIELGGVICKKATAHNAKFVSDNNIGPGALIIVQRSGDVIPYILAIKNPAPDGPQMPDIAYEWTSIGQGVDIKVLDDGSVMGQEQRINHFIHFSTVMDIEGLKEGKIRKLIEEDIISDISDLWTIKSKDLEGIDGFGPRAISNIMNALKEMQEKRSLPHLMAATNIFGRGLSVKTLKLIVNGLGQYLKSEKRARKLTEEDLVAIEGIGPTKATAFIRGLEDFLSFISKIGNKLSDYWHEEEEISIESPQKFKDQIIVFTGFRNASWTEIVEKNGGKVNNSISSKTTLVVAKDINKSQNSLTKARELGITIISSNDFEKDYL